MEEEIGKEKIWVKYCRWVTLLVSDKRNFYKFCKVILRKGK